MTLHKQFQLHSRNHRPSLVFSARMFLPAEQLQVLLFPQKSLTPSQSASHYQISYSCEPPPCKRFVSHSSRLINFANSFSFALTTLMLLLISTELELVPSAQF